MSLFADAPPNWPLFWLWVMLTLWVGLYFVVAALVSVLIFKVFRLTWELRQERSEAAEDRKQTRDLLTIIRGWALVVERKEQRKEQQIQAVADAAAQTAVEIREAVAGVAPKVAEILKQTASDSGVLKAPPLGGP